MNKGFFFLLALYLKIGMYGQCGAGEVALTMSITTDAWPYETYWQITPAGDGCSDTPLAEGSNLNVGCAGIASDNSPEGYGAETVVEVGLVCLQEGETYTLHFIDSYGDGGLRFEVFQNNIFTSVWVGEGFGNQWTFTAGEFLLPVYDSPCGASTITEDDLPLSMNNTNAVALSSEVRPPALDCSVYGQWCEGGVSNSVWAKFNPSTDGTYRFSTCNEGNAVDTQLAVWKADDCSDFSTYTLITANDDAQGGCDIGEFFSSVAFASCMEPGSDYYIQLDGWNGATGEIRLSVELVEGNVVADAVVFGAPCPVDKGETAMGTILPFLTNTGSDFSSVWSGPGGFISSDPFLSDVPAGSYTWMATDACGQMYEATYTIEVPAFWTFTPTAEEPLCAGSDDGFISVEVQGGTAPYTYQWLGPDFQSDFPSIEGLVEGVYQLTVTDDNECQYSQTYPLEASDGFTFDFGAPIQMCLEDSVEVSAPIVGNYLWQNGSTSADVVIAGAVWGIGSHSLQLTVTSAEGCVAVDDLAFTVSACIGVDENNAGVGATIYPQPVTGGVMNLRSENGAEWQYAEVFDMAGRNVARFTLQGAGPHVLPMEQARGAYFLKLTDGGRSAGLFFLVE
jgi:hypothetical protein